jgi:hypothetical protein
MLASVLCLLFRNLDTNNLFTYSMVLPDAVAQAQLVAFQAALGRIGFTPAQQDALNKHGFTGMYNMLIYSKDQIKRVCSVIHECTVSPSISLLSKNSS